MRLWRFQLQLYPQSIESENYGHEPCRPWQGILELHHNPGGAVYYLHRFNREGNADSTVIVRSVPHQYNAEYDTNGIAIVHSVANLFDTEAEAITQYRIDCFRHAMELLNAARDWFAKIKPI